MGKKYVARLSDEERKICDETVDRLKGSSQKARRARILHQVDADGPGWTDRHVAEAFRYRVRTVENVHRWCELEGFTPALEGRKRPSPPVPKLLDGRQEAQLVALRVGPPPDYGNWSLRLLSRQVVELGIVGSISHETVNRTRQKKHNGAQAGVLGDPARGGRRVRGGGGGGAGDVRAVPPGGMQDEQPVQLVRETREPVLATAAHPQRVDYEYERAGTAAVFLFCEPPSGWR